MVVFCSPTVIEEAKHLRQVNLHMDGTFSVVPRSGHAQQLFIVHLRYRNAIFPILYVLMERRVRAIYNVLLNYLKREILGEEVVVVSVMADYERALRLAVKDIYPQTKLLGCWFHYAKAVYLKSRQIGLTGRLNVRYHIAQGVNMAMVLPLIQQENFETGIDEVRNWMTDNVQGGEIEQIATFIQYLRRQWSRANVSVYKEDMRTNNYVESFHSI